MQNSIFILEVMKMAKVQISELLMDDYRMLAHYLEGKSIKKILSCTETQVALLLDDNTIVKFLHFEDDLIFDIKSKPSSSSEQRASAAD